MSSLEEMKQRPACVLHLLFGCEVIECGLISSEGLIEKEGKPYNNAICLKSAHRFQKLKRELRSHRAILSTCSKHHGPLQAVDTKMSKLAS